MAVEIVMPKFGLTMEEGTIQRWHRAVGEAVRQGEPLFEVETEKVLTEVESPADGTLACILQPVETVIAVGTLIAVIAEAGEDAAAVAARFGGPAPAAAAPAQAAAPAARPARAGGPVSPAARKLAAEHGVDLARVVGTGPEGRVTRQDVLDAAAGRAQAPKDEVIPLRGMRATIAERMTASLREAPQLTLTTTVDVTALVAHRRRLEAEFPVTVNDLLLAATVRALVAHPRLNAHLEEREIRLQRTVGLGVAVAVDDGLVVPVIHGAERLDLRALAARARELGERARAGSLALDDVSGGTFTVTNLGALGVETFTPILNRPQVAILGVGRVAARPWVVDGTVQARDVLHLSLTFDHRALDGAPAARFLGEVARILSEEPDSLR